MLAAGIAQLARASAFQAEGCGFETRFPLQKYAGIAQLVEQLICNQQVAGSSPVASSIKKLYTVLGKSLVLPVFINAV